MIGGFLSDTVLFTSQKCAVTCFPEKQESKSQQTVSLHRSATFCSQQLTKILFSSSWLDSYQFFSIFLYSLCISFSDLFCQSSISPSWCLATILSFTMNDLIFSPLHFFLIYNFFPFCAFLSASLKKH